VAASATCQRLIVVSRGEKKFSPIVRMGVPPWLMVASGFELFAVPGSPSLAYWPRSSLKRVGVKEEVSVPATVSVLTSELPLCSKAIVDPLLSKPTPVKLWWL
jgi:hypothetical protein